MKQDINDANDLLRVLTKAAQILADTTAMATFLAESDDPDIRTKLMNPIITIMTAIDVSASFSVMDDPLGRGDGPMSRLSDIAARKYGATYARLILSGSSIANVTLAFALRGKFERPPRVLVDRACHVSVAGGLAMAGADVVWALRRTDETYGIQPPFSAADITMALDGEKDIDVLWITSPSYDGILASDMAAIRRACDERGVMLIVDSAWGAYLGLLQPAGFPGSPAVYAHATVISLHKHGLGLSGASAVLFNDVGLMAEFGRFCDLGLTSTSPTFYAAAALEKAFEDWDGPTGQAVARAVIGAAGQFRTAMAKLEGVTPIEASALGEDLLHDPSHQLFCVQATGVTGYHLLNELAAKYAIDAEKATLTSILFLFGPEQIGNWPRIVDAVHEILEAASTSSSDLPALPPAKLPPKAVSMHEALFRPHRIVTAAEAVGKISGQMIAVYPPGSAIVQPGERFTADRIDFLQTAQDAGSRIKGIDGRLADTGLIIIEDQPTQE